LVRSKKRSALLKQLWWNYQNQFAQKYTLTFRINKILKTAWNLSKIDFRFYCENWILISINRRFGICPIDLLSGEFLAQNLSVT
jgi:hypothetical protein